MMRPWHWISGTGSRLRRLLAVGGALALAVALLQAITSPPSFAVQFCNTTVITSPTFFATAPGAASPYPSSIAVSGLTGTVTDVNVSLVGFTTSGDSNSGHWAEDADVLVSAPGGSNVILMSDAGGDNNTSSGPVAGANLTLDDQAANPLPADSLLSTGTYRPVDDDDDAGDGPDTWPAPAPATSNSTTLSTFNGTDPNGTWYLWATDDVSGGPYSLAGGWCIDILTAGGASTSSTSTTTTSTTTTTTTTSTTTTTTSTTTTSTTVVPAGDCAATGLAFGSAAWTIDNQQQVRVRGTNLGTSPTRCRTTVFARRVSPQNGPTAPDYPARYVVTVDPGVTVLSYFYVTPPVPGTYRVTGCVRSVDGSGAVNDTKPSNDCKTARRTAT